MANSGNKFEEFNGQTDDWVIYKERLEQFFKANGTKDDVKTACLLSFVGTNTYKLLRDLCHPEKPDSKTFEALSQMLEKHFSSQTNVWKERKIFSEANQESRETVSEYYARICNLAMNCKYGPNLKTFLKEKLVTGLKSTRIFERLCEEDENTDLERLLELAKKKEDSEHGDMNFIRTANFQHGGPGPGQQRGKFLRHQEGGRGRPWQQHEQRHAHAARAPQNRFGTSSTTAAGQSQRSQQGQRTNMAASTSIGKQKKCKTCTKIHNDNGGPGILGRDWLDAFGIGFEMVKNISVSGEVNGIVKKYPEVFDGHLGKFKFAKVKLHLKENATPIFCKPRPVPLAYKKMVDEELERLEKEGIITPVETSEWATPLVPILKGDGKVRLCGDYSVTVNKFLKETTYPLPRVEELFAKLHKGSHFTKLDLSQAYNQFELDEESKMILTISSTKGLYKMNRLPFGVTIASFVFQKYIEQLFVGMENCCAYLDDIILTGATSKEHLETLNKVLQRLKEAGLTLKLEKCEFFKDSVEYLGHVITGQGLKKSESKTKAIINAPRPTNLTEVRSFVGMVNYYGKFIPNVSQTLAPIYDLQKNNKSDKINWNSNCETAFKKIKELIASDLILVHYNPDLPIILSTDASDKGISAVLAHRMPNGQERPIYFMSRTLTNAEQRWPICHREAAAIYYSVNKFYQYLYGKRFILRTDNKALVTIFGEKKGIPQMYASRLQRWAAYLSTFNYEIQHIAGKDNIIPDYLSRAPLNVNFRSEDEKCQYLNFTSTLEEWPIDNEEIRKETEKDEVLKRVIEWIQNGKWPRHMTENCKPFLQRRAELTIEKGVLLLGHRIVIPKTLQGKLLNELHFHHFGINKTKSLARSYLYWPNLDKQIENMCKSCIHCLENRQAPPKEKNTGWKPETSPFKRIHMDFLEFNKKIFLIIIDSFSKWPEIYLMNKANAEETEEKLKDAISKYGIPETIVSDNGPQFTSAHLQVFFKRNGIRHITSPPFNPSSNGQAENAVKTFKNNLKTRLSDPKNGHKSLNILILEFLFSYRTTPHGSTKETSAKLMFGRELRTRFQILRENLKKTEDKTEHHKKNKFEKREVVMVMDYRTRNRRTWAKATIEKIIGENTYMCRLDEGLLWKRHTNQILKTTLTNQNQEGKSLGEQSENVTNICRSKYRSFEDQTVSLTLPTCSQSPESQQTNSEAISGPMQDVSAKVTSECQPKTLIFEASNSKISTNEGNSSNCDISNNTPVDVDSNLSNDNRNVILSSRKSDKPTRSFSGSIGTRVNQDRTTVKRVIKTPTKFRDYYCN